MKATNFWANEAKKITESGGVLDKSAVLDKGVLNIEEEDTEEIEVESLYGIHAVFLDPNEKEDYPDKHLGYIPAKVKEMFLKEYGLRLEYNYEARLLYPIKDDAPSGNFSYSAKKILKSQLITSYKGGIKAQQRKAKLKYGTLIFGNNPDFNDGFGKKIKYAHQALGVIGSPGDAYINLFNFDDELNPVGFDFKHFDSWFPNSRRTINMARFFEQVWLGGLHFRGTDPIVGRDGIGKNTRQVNIYRKEMELPEQIIDASYINYLAFGEPGKKKEIENNLSNYIKEYNNGFNQNESNIWKLQNPDPNFYLPIILY